MAPSPFLDALASRSGQRKGCPVNVLFLEHPEASYGPLVNALAGQELLRGAQKPPKALQVREHPLGSAAGTRVLFTTVALPPHPLENDAKPTSAVSEASTSTNAVSEATLEPLRRHLLSRRPANAIVYLHPPHSDDSEESLSGAEAALLDALEASLGKSLWQNAVCVTAVGCEGGKDSDSLGGLRVPGALLRPGFQPAACLWDGSQESTGELAQILAEVVGNTLPFLPEPRAKQQQQQQQQQALPHGVETSPMASGPAFQDLELLCDNNMLLMQHVAAPSQAPLQPTPNAVAHPEAKQPPLLLQGPQGTQKSALPQADGAAKQLSPFAVQQAPLVPAFASLSLVFAPPMALSSRALVHTSQRTPALKGKAAAPPPPALRGLATVTASMPSASLGSTAASLASKAASFAVPGVAGSVPVGRVKVPANATAFPDIMRLPRNGPTFRPPRAAAASARVVLAWFRNDLRVHDNEALVAANRDGVAVLPVYCFDPRDYGKSSSGFDRTGPFRARFLLQCVSDLRHALRARGSDLIVRVGPPERELASLAKAVGAKALYSHQEVTREDGGLEGRVASALKDEGVESSFFWGSTLYHVDDLPFSLDDMPCNYGGFREAVKALKVRATVDAPKRMRQLPARGNLSPGDIPSLTQLGISTGSASIEIKEPALTGGEGEALKRLKAFLGEAMALQPTAPPRAGTPSPAPPSSSSTANTLNSSNTNSNSSSSSSTIGPCMLGASFSCKISPWLAMGCLSPRRMFEEMKAVLPSTTSAGATSGAGGGDKGLAVSLDWIVFELLWRDFFRFITKKHASARKDAVAPALAAA